MVQAWLMAAGEPANPQALNQRTPNVEQSVEDLRDLGVIHWDLDPATMLVPQEEGALCKVDQIAADLGFKNRDECKCSREALPDYDAALKTFFTEHLHEDDEIRLVKEGSGFFDIRNAKDEWVRMAVRAGDLVILPAGAYHRFIMDEQNSMHAVRIFKDAPKWTPVNRPADDNATRVAYVAAHFPVPRRMTPAGEAQGQANGIHCVHFPAEFDATVRPIARGLRVAERDLAVLYFTGSVIPQMGKSWCPDCVTTGPLVAAGLEELRQAAPGRKVTFVCCPVQRTTYLNNPGMLYRTHPLVQLNGGVPTLIVLKGTDGGADDGAGAAIAKRFDGDVPAGWAAGL